MRVTAEVKARVKATIEACIVTANAHYDRVFNYPTVVYKKRGTTAGTACDRTYTIDLNSVLLMENVEAFLQRTVVHEFAHLVDGIVNPSTRQSRWGQKRSLHGPTWKRIMRLFGASEDRCHSYDTTNSRVKKRAKHVWTCSCGQAAGTMKIGTIRHNKMKAPGPVRYWMRGHKNHTYTYQGVEGAPAPRVLPKAASAPRAPKRRTGPSKLDICRQWFSSSASRTLMINTFVKEAGCTPNGAATYYAKIKKEF